MQVAQVEGSWVGVLPGHAAEMVGIGGKRQHKDAEMFSRPGRVADRRLASSRASVLPTPRGGLQGKALL